VEDVADWAQLAADGVKTLTDCGEVFVDVVKDVVNEMREPADV
jgi:hypothetical protein